MFAKHVLTNLEQIAPRVLGMFCHHENVFFPVGRTYSNLEARLTLLLVPCLLYARRKFWLPRVRPNLERHR